MRRTGGVRSAASAAVAGDEILALIGHAVLDGDAAAERRDAVDVALVDGFRMVDEPVQAVERHVPVHLLEHVEGAGDGLVVGGMQPPRPAVLGEQAHDGLEVALHGGRHLRPFDLEVLEVGCAVDQHLAGAVVAVEIVALSRLDLLRPGLEVLQLLLRLLGEQVVGEAHGQLPLPVQLLDDRVIVRIVLKPAAGIDDAGHAEPVDLAHEVARRVLLVFGRKLGALRQGRVEDRRIGPGDQQAGGIALRIALDLAAGRVRRILRVADRAQGRAVQQRPVVEMQDEDGCVRRNRVDLVEGSAGASRRTDAP